MKPFAEQTLYEILEVPFDAPESEIVRAWERAESLYGPGSLSTYTLISPDEAAVMSAKLEEALNVLLDPAERGRYDARMRVRAAAHAVRGEGGPAARGGTRLEVSLPPIIPALGASSSSAGAALDRVFLLAAAPDCVARAGALAVALQAVPPPEESASPEDEDAAGSSTEKVSSPAPHRTLELACAAAPDIHAAADEAGYARDEVVSAPGTEIAPSSRAAKEQADLPESGVPGTVADTDASPGACSTEQREGRDPAPILLSRVAEEPVPPIPLCTLAPVSPVSPPFAAMLAGPAPAASTLSRAASKAPEPVAQKMAPAEKELVLPEGVPFTGEVLRRAREARGLSVPQICERTKISRHHLENIEAERREKLPAPVYLRGILMALAKELRLDGQKVARSYLSQAPARDP